MDLGSTKSLGGRGSVPKWTIALRTGRKGGRGVFGILLSIPDTFEKPFLHSKYNKSLIEKALLLSLTLRRAGA